VRRNLVCGEFAHRLAELLLLFGELEIQALPPAIGVSTWLMDI
jgi:hypothetical protein